MGAKILTHACSSTKFEDYEMKYLTIIVVDGKNKPVRKL